VRPHPPYTAGVGTEADESLIAEWTAEVRAHAQAALEEARRAAELPEQLEVVVARGETWEEAREEVEWREGDVLVVGSSSMGPIARVFLGSRATKIVQHSPVPVVVVPRGVVAEIADAGVREHSGQT
jgi:nucleotide-binding universal stress UspA family protein